MFKTNLERLSNILRCLENCSAKQFFYGSIVLHDVGWQTFCVVLRRQRSQHLLSRCMTTLSLLMRYAAVVILCMLMIMSAAFTAASRLMHKVSRGHGNLENHGILLDNFPGLESRWKSYGKWRQYTGCMVPRRRRWSSFNYPTASLQYETTPYGLVYHAMCLFTPPAFAGYLTCLPTEDGSGWVGLGAEVV